jgi:hypothetical protein
MNTTAWIFEGIAIVAAVCTVSRHIQIRRRRVPGPPKNLVADSMNNICLIAGEKTNGYFFCSREKGHDGPCAGHPVSEI